MGTQPKPQGSLFPNVEPTDPHLLRYIKTTTTDLTSWALMDLAMREMDFLKTSIRTIQETEMKEVTAIGEKYTPQLNHLRAALGIISDKMEEFCAAHKNELELPKQEELLPDMKRENDDSIFIKKLEHGTIIYTTKTTVKVKVNAQ